MARVPDSVSRFLGGQCLAVAGVSRDTRQPANAIYRKLRDAGYEVVPLNPNASAVEGVACYPNLAACPGQVDGVVIATHPDVSAELVRECGEHGIEHVWFHRSFGQGSVSEEAVRECDRLGLQCIVGGCPLMYCEPVDIAHRCMRWWLGRRSRIPR
jgi:predicted CoA-binding protein